MGDSMADGHQGKWLQHLQGYNCSLYISTHICKDWPRGHILPIATAPGYTAPPHLTEQDALQPRCPLKSPVMTTATSGAESPITSSSSAMCSLWHTKPWSKHGMCTPTTETNNLSPSHHIPRTSQRKFDLTNSL